MDRIESDKEIEGSSNVWGDDDANVWNEDPWKGNNTNGWSDTVDNDGAWKVDDYNTTKKLEVDGDEEESEVKDGADKAAVEMEPEQDDGRQSTDLSSIPTEELVTPAQGHDKSVESGSSELDVSHDNDNDDDDNDDFNEFDDFEEYSEAPPETVSSPTVTAPTMLEHIDQHHLEPTKLNIYDVETHLASIFASITSPPLTGHPEGTVLDIHSDGSSTNPRKLYNQFRRPTRQFVCVDSKPDPIVRWRASAVEGEVLKVLQHWKEREYSKSRNALFGWANKRSASVKAPIAPQFKETSTRVVSDTPQTRPSHQMQPPVQQRFSSTARPADDISIKRPTPLRIDKIKGHAKTASVSGVPVSTGSMDDWPTAMPQTPSITSRPPPFHSPRNHSRQASVSTVASGRSSPMNPTFTSSTVLPASFADQLASPTEMKPVRAYDHLSSTKSRSTSNTPPLVSDSVSVFSKPSPPERPSSALAPANGPPPAVVDQFAIFDSKPLPKHAPKQEAVDDPFSIFESNPVPQSKRSSVVLPSSFANALASPTEMIPAKPIPNLHTMPPQPPQPPRPPPPPKELDQDDDDWGDFQTDTPSPPPLAPASNSPPAAVAARHAATSHVQTAVATTGEISQKAAPSTTFKLGPVSKTKQQSKSSDDEVVHRIVNSLPDLSYLM